MAWSGFFKYGDVEIINVARTHSYAETLGLAWVKNTDPEGRVGDALATALDEGEYLSPALDLAPWYDPDSPESREFAGIIPLEIEGIENSTRSSEVFEFTGDGGNPGTLRHSTKAPTFSVALVGANDCAVEYGFRWLKRALMRRQCAPGATVSCVGQDLSYARCMPPGGVTSAEWETDYLWHLRDVLFNRGPVVNSKRSLKGCNGAIWLVSFTAAVGDPFEYGATFPVIENLISHADTATSPYVDGYTGIYGKTTYPWATCPAYQNTPIYDPDFSPFTPPPQAPDLMPSGYTTPSGTQARTYAEIPAITIPLWDEVRPTITLKAGDTPQRMIRIRIYPGGTPPNQNCGYIGEYTVSYLPANYTLVIDTAQEAIYAYTNDGMARRADSLVFGPTAMPPRWFGLSCGDSYLMTVDMNGTVSGFDLDLDLTPRSA